MYSSQLKKKIASYSVLAGGILASGTVRAQVVYTDVNPDVTINLGDSYSIDLNNDGIVDYMVKGVKANNGSWQKIELDNPSSGNINEIAAYVSPYSYVYASLFSAGSMIDNNREFHFGYGHGYASESYPFATMFISYTTGYAYGQWSGAFDGYAGVRFDKGGQKYYGWIRMDVSIDGSSAVIKDFAYEQTHDVGITAGAGIVGIEMVPPGNQIKTYVAGGFLNIISSGLNYPAALKIYNEQGQLEKEFTVNSSIQQFELRALSFGIYFITFSDKNKLISSKIIFNNK